MSFFYNNIMNQVTWEEFLEGKLHWEYQLLQKV